MVGKPKPNVTHELVEASVIHFAVIADPKRREQSEALANRLAADLLVDREFRGHQWNHRRGWATTPRWADWACVLESDAILCPTFEQCLEREISQADDKQVLQLYSGTNYPRQIQHRYRAAFTARQHLTTSRTWHAVGTAAPTTLIHGLLDATRGTTRPWDEAMGDHIQAIGWTVKATYPSHVDHEDGPSTLPPTTWQPRNKPRRAHHMCGTRNGPTL